MNHQPLYVVTYQQFIPDVGDSAVVDIAYCLTMDDVEQFVQERYETVEGYRVVRGEPHRKIKAHWTVDVLNEQGKADTFFRLWVSQRTLYTGDTQDGK